MRLLLLVCRFTVGVLIYFMLATYSLGQVRTVVVSGQNAPGVPDAQFASVATTDFSAPGSGTTVRDFELNDNGRVAFGAMLIGADMQESNDEGIWFERKDGLALVAREGGQVPNEQLGVVFDRRPSVRFNNNDHIAFLATLGGKGIDESNDEGIWSNRSGELAVVLREGWAAPGTEAGTVFGKVLADGNLGRHGPTFWPDSSSRLAFNDSDQIAIKASLQGASITRANAEGIWSERDGTLQLVVRESAAAPETDEPSFFLTKPYECEIFGRSTMCESPVFHEYVLNGNGDVAFTATLDDSGRGVWAQQQGNLTLVARNGMHAPGMDAGQLFTHFGIGHAGLNDSGHSVINAYAATTGEDEYAYEGIWTDRSGDLALVAVEGNKAPGTEVGTNYRSFNSYLSQNSSGELAFSAFLEGPAVARPSQGKTGNYQGTWADVSGELLILTRRGMSASGTDGVFDSLDSGPKLINNSGQIAFKATVLSDGNYREGIWGVNTLGETQVVVLAGSEIEIGKGDIRTVESIANSLTPHQFNEVGQIAFWARFEDSSDGIFVATISNGCDFNRDALCNVSDLQAVDGLFGSGDIAMGVPALGNEVFDLNNDHTINDSDITNWLGLAAAEMGFTAPFVPGDTDLDGSVDFADFLRLANNFPGGLEWTDGNFDGSLDGTQFSDFLLLSQNFGSSISEADSSSVPEPPGMELAVITLVLLLHPRRRRAG